MAASALRTRRPTNLPSWPIILLAGEGKTGKTYRAAEFTGDDRIGRAFMLDLGEGTADEYGAVPGADYEIIDHDGTWIDIVSQVEAVRDVAREALANGEKPVCLIIDSMSAEWAMLSAWTDTRARRSKGNQVILRADPDAEIEVGHMYWNDATSRHNRLMNILKTFPGIVILTALEGEKTQFGPDGRPLKINGKPAPKVARPEAQKRLTADSTVWVRLSLDTPPTIVGIRSLRNNILPGKDRPQPWEDFTIAKLVFEFMGLDAATTQPRDVPVLDADQVAPGEEIEPAQPAQLDQRSRLTARPQKVTKSIAERAADAVDKLLDTSDSEAARAMAKYAHTEAALGRTNVSGLLTEQDRDRLDTGPKGNPVSLRQFADLVVSWIERTDRSVRADPPVDAGAAEPAAAVA